MDSKLSGPWLRQLERPPLLPNMHTLNLQVSQNVTAAGGPCLTLGLQSESHAPSSIIAVTTLGYSEGMTEDDEGDEGEIG